MYCSELALNIHTHKKNINIYIHTQARYNDDDEIIKNVFIYLHRRTKKEKEDYNNNFFDERERERGIEAVKDWE